MLVATIAFLLGHESPLSSIKLPFRRSLILRYIVIKSIQIHSVDSFTIWLMAKPPFCWGLNAAIFCSARILVILRRSCWSWRTIGSGAEINRLRKSLVGGLEQELIWDLIWVNGTECILIWTYIIDLYTGWWFGTFELRSKPLCSY